jgi:hypothetical protein
MPTDDDHPAAGARPDDPRHASSDHVTRPGTRAQRTATRRSNDAADRDTDEQRRRAELAGEPPETMRTRIDRLSERSDRATRDGADIIGDSYATAPRTAGDPNRPEPNTPAERSRAAHEDRVIRDEIGD